MASACTTWLATGEWTRSLWGTDFMKPDFVSLRPEDAPTRKALDAGGEILAGRARRLLGQPSGPRALCLPRLGSPVNWHQRLRFSCGVAFCPCFLALPSGISVLWSSGFPDSGGGAGEPSPRRARCARAFYAVSGLAGWQHPFRKCSRVCLSRRRKKNNARQVLSAHAANVGRHPEHRPRRAHTQARARPGRMGRRARPPVFPQAAPVALRLPAVGALEPVCFI